MVGLHHSSFVTLLRQPHEKVKYTQTIRRQKLTNYLSVFDHFMGLASKGLSPLLFMKVLKVLSREMSSGYSEKLPYPEGLLYVSELFKDLRETRSLASSTGVKRAASES